MSDISSVLFVDQQALGYLSGSAASSGGLGSSSDGSGISKSAIKER